MASSREPTLRVDRSAPADSEESSDEELQCQRCGQMVPTAAELVAHTKVCKRALSKKISNTSYDVLENSTRPTVASRKYTGEDTGGSSSSSQHECSACSKTFRSAKALKIHISRSKPCKTYNATSVPLEQSLSLFRAEDIDPTESSQENNNKWTCESCNRLFESHKGLQTHGRYCKATRQNGDSDARTVVNCGDEGYSDSSLSEETTWICKSCDRPFESQRGLHTHGRYCSGRSSKNEAIDRAGEEVSICAYCRRRFNSAKELQMHSTLCTKNPFNAGSTAAAAAGELFLCDFCDRSFESKKGLKTHGRFCHSRLLATSNAAAVVTPSESSDEPLSSCQRCGRSFDSEKGLKTHERFCNKKKRSGEHSVAPDTSFGTASPPGDGQLKVGEVAWICTSCGRSFESERGLKTHGQFCNESSLSRNAEVFEEVPTSADLANFEKHAATGAHEGHGFVCSACHRSFDSERGLKAHGRFCKDASTTNDTANQTAMTSNDENENVCDSCGRSFDSVRGLQTHSRYCDKPSVTKESADDDSNDAADAVSAATSGTSSDEDHEFVCVACDRSFDSVRGLKTHARYCDNIQAKPAEESNKTDDAIISVVDEGNDTADRDREFTCGLCNRSFNSEKGLKTHSRFCLNVSKINGTAGTAAATSSDDEQTEYEHVCDSCSRSFDSMRGLATHMRFCNTAKESAEDSNEADERVSVGAKEKSESADSKEEEDGERTHQSLALAVQEDSSAVPRTEADSAVVLQRCLHRLRQVNRSHGRVKPGRHVVGYGCVVVIVVVVVTMAGRINCRCAAFIYSFLLCSFLCAAAG